MEQWTHRGEFQDLERLQQSALRLILQESYKSYPNALKVLSQETLTDRRKCLCLQFVKKCLNNDKMKELFPKNSKAKGKLSCAMLG